MEGNDDLFTAGGPPGIKRGKGPQPFLFAESEGSQSPTNEDLADDSRSEDYESSEIKGDNLIALQEGLSPDEVQSPADSYDKPQESANPEKHPVPKQGFFNMKEVSSDEGNNDDSIQMVFPTTFSQDDGSAGTDEYQPPPQQPQITRSRNHSRKSLEKGYGGHQFSQATNESCSSPESGHGMNFDGVQGPSQRFKFGSFSRNQDDNFDSPPGKPPTGQQIRIRVDENSTVSQHQESQEESTVPIQPFPRGSNRWAANELNVVQEEKKEALDSLQHSKLIQFEEFKQIDTDSANDYGQKQSPDQRQEPKKQLSLFVSSSQEGETFKTQRAKQFQDQVSHHKSQSQRQQDQPQRFLNAVTTDSDNISSEVYGDPKRLFNHQSSCQEFEFVGKRDSSRVSDRIYDKMLPLSTPTNYGEEYGTRNGSSNKSPINAFPGSPQSKINSQSNEVENKVTEGDQDYSQGHEELKKQVEEHTRGQLVLKTMCSEDSDNRAKRLRREDQLEREISRLEKLNLEQAQRLQEPETTDEDFDLLEDSEPSPISSNAFNRPGYNQEADQNQLQPIQFYEVQEDLEVNESKMQRISDPDALQQDQQLQTESSANKSPFKEASVVDRQAENIITTQTPDPNMDYQDEYDRYIENKVLSSETESPEVVSPGQIKFEKEPTAPINEFQEEEEKHDFKQQQSDQDVGERKSRKLYVITEESASNMGGPQSQSDGEFLMKGIDLSRINHGSQLSSKQKNQIFSQSEGQRRQLSTGSSNKQVTESVGRDSNSLGGFLNTDLGNGQSKTNSTTPNQNFNKPPLTTFNSYNGLGTQQNTQSVSRGFKEYLSQARASSGRDSSLNLRNKNSQQIQPEDLMRAKSFNSAGNNPNFIVETNLAGSVEDQMDSFGSTPVMRSQQTPQELLVTNHTPTPPNVQHLTGEPIRHRQSSLEYPNKNSDIPVEYLKQVSNLTANKTDNGNVFFSSSSNHNQNRPSNNEHVPFEMISEDDLLSGSNFDRMSKLLPAQEHLDSEQVSPQQRNQNQLLHEIKLLQNALIQKDQVIQKLQQEAAGPISKTKVVGDMVEVGCLALPDTKDVKTQTAGPRKKSYYDSIPAKVCTKPESKTVIQRGHQCPYHPNSSPHQDMTTKTIESRDTFNMGTGRSNTHASPGQRGGSTHAKRTTYSPIARTLFSPSKRGEPTREETQQLREQMQNLKVQLMEQERETMIIIDNNTRLEKAKHDLEEELQLLHLEQQQKMDPNKLLQDKVEELNNRIDSLLADKAELEKIIEQHDKKHDEENFQDQKIQTENALWHDFLALQWDQEQALLSKGSPRHQAAHFSKSNLLSQLSEIQNEVQGEQGAHSDYEKIQELVQKANMYERQYQQIESEIIEYRKCLRDAADASVTVVHHMPHQGLNTSTQNMMSFESTTPKQDKFMSIAKQQPQYSGNSFDKPPQPPQSVRDTTSNNNTPLLINDQNNVLNRSFADKDQQVLWLQNQYAHYRRKAKKLEKKLQKMHFEKVTNDQLIVELRNKLSDLNEKHRDAKSKYQMKLHERNLKIQELKTQLQHFSLYGNNHQTVPPAQPNIVYTQPLSTVPGSSYEVNNLLQEDNLKKNRMDQKDRISPKRKIEHFQQEQNYLPTFSGQSPSGPTTPTVPVNDFVNMISSIVDRKMAEKGTLPSSFAANQNTTTGQSYNSFITQENRNFQNLTHEGYQDQKGKKSKSMQMVGSFPISQIQEIPVEQEEDDNPVIQNQMHQFQMSQIQNNPYIQQIEQEGSEEDNFMQLNQIPSDQQESPEQYQNMSSNMMQDVSEHELIDLSTLQMDTKALQSTNTNQAAMQSLNFASTQQQLQYLQHLQSQQMAATQQIDDNELIAVHQNDRFVGKRHSDFTRGVPNQASYMQAMRIQGTLTHSSLQDNSDSAISNNFSNQLQELKQRKIDGQNTINHERKKSRKSSRKASKDKNSTSRKRASKSVNQNTGSKKHQRQDSRNKQSADLRHGPYSHQHSSSIGMDHRQGISGQFTFQEQNVNSGKDIESVSGSQHVGTINLQKQPQVLTHQASNLASEEGKISAMLKSGHFREFMSNESDHGAHQRSYGTNLGLNTANMSDTDGHTISTKHYYTESNQAKIEELRQKYCR